MRLGSDKDAPQVHRRVRGKVPQVDAVVNDSWIETLGMKPGNALLVDRADRPGVAAQADRADRR